MTNALFMAGIMWKSAGMAVQLNVKLSN